MNVTIETKVIKSKTYIRFCFSNGYNYMMCFDNSMGIDEISTILAIASNEMLK